MAEAKDRPSEVREALDRPQRRPRRWLFRGWVALTILVAGWVAVTAPFARGPTLDQSVVALAVPPLMILALGAGIAWLALLVTRGGDRPRDDGSSRTRR
ncbi:MAG: hypothetical protein RID91_10825 [Azospirillaceae bacterium]